MSHLKRCRLERVRAERIEGILLRSLKKLLSEPGLMEHWLDVYAPTLPTDKDNRLAATGTDGIGSNPKSQEKEGSLLSFPLSTRGGSTSVTSGAP